MKSPVLVAVVVVVSFSLACGPAKPMEPPPAPEKVLTTYKIISGVSMGGIGSSALGFTHPQRFDGIAPLGGPMNAAFFMHMIDSSVTAGFCTRAELQALMASDPVKLNDPAATASCSHRAPTIAWEHSQDFNHWHPTLSGGAFDRDTYLEMMSDLVIAYGNVFTDNDASPFAPFGVPIEKVRRPAADFCTTPAVVKGLVNAEYNPDGAYDAITFCDGEPALYYCQSDRSPVDFCADAANRANPLPRAMEQTWANTFCASKGGAVKLQTNTTADKIYWLNHAGRVDPCRQPATAVPIMLAFDMNKNGRRDYGEPVVNNGHERFDDTGVDGCTDEFENGSGGCATTATAGAQDPNHDNFDIDTRPEGTEKNFRHDDGEPFRDFGLDGVANTDDSGEGNGSFDMTRGWQKLFALDGQTNYRKLDAGQQKRINVFTDGGIRDVFNLGLMAKLLFSAVRTALPQAFGEYRSFEAIPGMLDKRTMAFNPWNALWRTTVPRNVAIEYGKDAPTDDELALGEGDHVGTPGQAVQRFTSLFNWAAATWPTLERPVTKSGGTPLDERQKVEWFLSSKLGAKWEYGVSLPPGYDDPANADARYPVVFMLHGYGMDATNFLGTAAIADLYTTDTDVKFRPMIYVFPNGRCCFTNATTGERDCREKDDTGADVSSKAGWVRECNSGTFWVNRSGYTPSDTTLYGDAFFELVDHIDQKYRTLAPREVETR